MYGKVPLVSDFLVFDVETEDLGVSSEVEFSVWFFFCSRTLLIANLASLKEEFVTAPDWETHRPVG